MTFLTLGVMEIDFMEICVVSNLTLTGLYGLYSSTCVSFKYVNLSVIRRKSESQKGCFKKTKHTKFSEKTNIPPP